MSRLRNILIVSLLFFVANTGFSEPVIQNFLISVWPEYDHPGVLVIFNGEINEADLPLEVSYPIPEQSRFALVAGSTDTTANRMIPLPIEEGSSGKQITFTVVQPTFHVEFYYNPFASGNAHRHYSYDFVSNLPIDSLVVDLQEPLAAQGFESEVPIDHQLQDSHGIKYYRKHYHQVSAGDTVYIEAHYENPEGTMTNEMLQSQMGGGSGMGQQGGATSESESGNFGSFWIILVVVVIILGVLYLVTQYSGGKQTPREQTAAMPEQGEPGASKVIEKTTPDQHDTKYCIHCGKPIPQKAKFCTQCGQSQGE